MRTRFTSVKAHRTQRSMSLLLALWKCWSRIQAADWTVESQVQVSRPKTNYAANATNHAKPLPPICSHTWAHCKIKWNKCSHEWFRHRNPTCGWVAPLSWKTTRYPSLMRYLLRTLQALASIEGALQPCHHTTGPSTKTINDNRRV